MTKINAYFPTYSTLEAARDAANFRNRTSEKRIRIYRTGADLFVVGPTGTASKFRRTFPSVSIEPV